MCVEPVPKTYSTLTIIQSSVSQIIHADASYVVWLSIQCLYQYSCYTSWNHYTEPGEESHCLFVFNSYIKLGSPNGAGFNSI